MIAHEGAGLRKAPVARCHWRPAHRSAPFMVLVALTLVALLAVAFPPMASGHPGPLRDDGRTAGSTAAPSPTIPSTSAVPPATADETPLAATDASSEPGDS